ncbi:MAG: GYD domain-containing protein [Acidimicrobiia bacterium]
MANYVILINWTAQGIASGKDSLNRASKAAATLKKLGGRMKTIMWTIGPYDAVSLIEAPDDETVTAFCLAVGAEGNVRTTTMRAFDRNEMGAIFDKI